MELRAGDLLTGEYSCNDTDDIPPLEPGDYLESASDGEDTLSEADSEPVHGLVASSDPESILPPRSDREESDDSEISDEDFTAGPHPVDGDPYAAETAAILIGLGILLDPDGT